jgi:hypothetical protein
MGTARTSPAFGSAYFFSAIKLKIEKALEPNGNRQNSFYAGGNTG